MRYLVRMALEWPEGEERKPTPRVRGSYWGGVRVSLCDESGTRPVLPIVLVVALLLVVAAVVFVYGLPPLFPRDCVGCFFSRP